MVTAPAPTLAAPPRPPQLDLAGLAPKQFADVASDVLSQGRLGLMDLTLAGLSYPARALTQTDLVAAWVHAVGISG